MRISLADSLWLVFGAACLLGIAYANRPIQYAPSQLVDIFSYRSICSHLKTVEYEAWVIGGESGATQMTIDLMTTSKITPPVLIEHFVSYAENATRESGTIIASNPIENDGHIVGHALTWESNHNFGFVEIVHLGINSGNVESKPKWEKCHKLYINRMEYWHPNAK